MKGDTMLCAGMPMGGTRLMVQRWVSTIFGCIYNVIGRVKYLETEHRNIKHSRLADLTTRLDFDCSFSSVWWLVLYATFGRLQEPVHS